jgi:hypothetical protein
MTRRPKKTTAALKVASKPRKAAKRARPKPRDPLDDFISAAARALDLTIDKAWMPAVRGHLQVTLRLGAVVTAFALPDDAEPAPVYKA